MVACPVSAVRCFLTRCFDENVECPIGGDPAGGRGGVWGGVFGVHAYMISKNRTIFADEARKAEDDMAAAKRKGQGDRTAAEKTRTTPGPVRTSRKL